MILFAGGPAPTAHPTRAVQGYPWIIHGYTSIDFQNLEYLWSLPIFCWGEGAGSRPLDTCLADENLETHQ